MRHLEVVTSDIPDPPYPADVRAKGWRFDLDIERIENSDTWTLAPADMRPWLLMLWMRSWTQTPCGSLPASDELVAARIGMDARAFAGNREILMRGWYRCADNRLYHPVITESVEIMRDSRLAERKKKAGQRAAAAAAAEAAQIEAEEAARVAAATAEAARIAAAQAAQAVLAAPAVANVPGDRPGNPEGVSVDSIGSPATGTGSGSGTGTGLKALPAARAAAAPSGALFDEFWAAYPKKKSKDDAVKAFAKRKPTRALLDSMLKAIREQRVSADWLREGGQFIPYPASWLNAGCWEDVVEVETAAPANRAYEDNQRMLARESQRSLAVTPETIRAAKATAAAARARLAGGSTSLKDLLITEAP